MLSWNGVRNIAPLSWTSCKNKTTYRLCSFFLNLTLVKFKREPMTILPLSTGNFILLSFLFLDFLQCSSLVTQEWMMLCLNITTYIQVIHCEQLHYKFIGWLWLLPAHFHVEFDSIPTSLMKRAPVTASAFENGALQMNLFIKC